MDFHDDFQWWCKRKQCKEAKLCENCEPICKGIFKKVYEMEESGLTFYTYGVADAKVIEKDKPHESLSFVLYNPKNIAVKKSSYTKDFDKYISNCVWCNILIKTLQTYLSDFEQIKENEVIGICRHCTLKGPPEKCKRCTYLRNKFLFLKNNHLEEKRRLEAKHDHLKNIFQEQMKSFVDNEITKSSSDLHKPKLQTEPYPQLPEKDENIYVTKQELNKLLGTQYVEKLPNKILASLGNLTKQTLHKVVGLLTTRNIIDNALQNLGRLSIDKLETIFGNDIAMQVIDRILNTYGKFTSDRIEKILGSDLTDYIIDSLLRKYIKISLNENADSNVGRIVSKSKIDLLTADGKIHQLSKKYADKVLGTEKANDVVNQILTNFGILNVKKIFNLLERNTAKAVINKIMANYGKITDQKLGTFLDPALSIRIENFALNELSNKIKKEGFETNFNPELLEEIKEKLISSICRNIKSLEQLDSFAGPKIGTQIVDKILTTLSNEPLLDEQLHELFTSELTEKEAIFFFGRNLTKAKINNVLNRDDTKTVVNKILKNLKQFSKVLPTSEKIETPRKVKKHRVHSSPKTVGKIGDYADTKDDNIRKATYPKINQHISEPQNIPLEIRDLKGEKSDLKEAKQKKAVMPPSTTNRGIEDMTHNSLISITSGQGKKDGHDTAKTKGNLKGISHEPDVSELNIHETEKSTKSPAKYAQIDKKNITKKSEEEHVTVQGQNKTVKTPFKDFKDSAHSEESITNQRKDQQLPNSENIESIGAAKSIKHTNYERDEFDGKGKEVVADKKLKEFEDSEHSEESRKKHRKDQHQPTSHNKDTKGAAKSIKHTINEGDKSDGKGKEIVAGKKLKEYSEPLDKKGMRSLMNELEKKERLEKTRKQEQIDIENKKHKLNEKAKTLLDKGNSYEQGKKGQIPLNIDKTDRKNIVDLNTSNELVGPDEKFKESVKPVDKEGMKSLMKELEKQKQLEKSRKQLEENMEKQKQKLSEKALKLLKSTDKGDKNKKLPNIVRTDPTAQNLVNIKKNEKQKESIPPEKMKSTVELLDKQGMKSLIKDLDKKHQLEKSKQRLENDVANQKQKLQEKAIKLLKSSEKDKEKLPNIVRTDITAQIVERTKEKEKQKELKAQLRAPDMQESSKVFDKHGVKSVFKELEKKEQLKKSRQQLEEKMANQKEKLKERAKKLLQAHKKDDLDRTLSNIKKLSVTDLDMDYGYMHKPSDKLVKGTRIVRYRSSEDLPLAEKSPLLFQKDCSESESSQSVIRQFSVKLADADTESRQLEHSSSKSPLGNTTSGKFKSQPILGRPSTASGAWINSQQKMTTGTQVHYKGIIYYQLSDPECIEKGWTQLPTIQILRRFNIYRSTPAKPNLNWFGQHNIRNQTKTLFYDCGSKLAEVDPDGHGRWYYRNGILALDYYKSEEPLLESRYVIYSSGVNDENDKPNTIAVLAVFDNLGHGTILDNRGNERLIYNQSEGVIIDESIGVPGRWLWNDLNKKTTMVQVVSEKYEDIPILGKHTQHETQKKYPYSDHSRPGSPQRRPSVETELRQLEFKNILKNRELFFGTYTPFKIKPKTFKINKYFSLHIIDQTNIQLIYRDGATVLKHNLGVSLDTSNIINVENTGFNHVWSPLDRQFLSKTPSLQEISNIICRTKTKNKVA